MSKKLKLRIDDVALLDLFATVISPAEPFKEWVDPILRYGWHVHEIIENPIMYQVVMRKEGWNSEIQITKENGGFTAEHVMRVLPEPDGVDRSHVSYRTVVLKELLRHIAYTR